MSTHIVACLMLYRHRQVRVALYILLILFSLIEIFLLNFILLLRVGNVAVLLHYDYKVMTTRLFKTL